jgi:hypothetical protein
MAAIDQVLSRLRPDDLVVAPQIAAPAPTVCLPRVGIGCGAMSPSSTKETRRCLPTLSVGRLRLS